MHSVCGVLVPIVTTDSLPHASEVPLIGDSVWMGAWPSPADGIPQHRTKGGGGGLGNFSLNRHDQSMNLTFMDGSGRGVLVDKLKTLYWSTHPK